MASLTRARHLKTPHKQATLIAQSKGLTRTTSVILTVLAGLSVTLSFPTFGKSEKSQPSKKVTQTSRKATKSTAREKAQLSITDPECLLFPTSSIDWSEYSAKQKASFEYAAKLHTSGHLAATVKLYQALVGQCKSYKILYNLGVAQAEAGDLEKAKRALQESLAINPQQKEAYKLLSQIDKALGHEIEAKYNLDRYLQL